MHSLSLFFSLILVSLVSLPVYSIKFELPASRYPQHKCVWNAAHKNTLVIVTAVVSPGNSQRIDIDIIDRGDEGNVYLSKKNITGETRLAITSHAEGDVGACFKNHLDFSTSCVRIVSNPI